MATGFLPLESVDRRRDELARWPYCTEMLGTLGADVMRTAL